MTEALRHTCHLLKSHYKNPSPENLQIWSAYPTNHFHHVFINLKLLCGEIITTKKNP